MGLQTQSIGKSMQYGFAGSFSRQPDMIVNTAPLGGEMPILFGTALKRGENGAVLPMGAGDTANQFVGIAGREVKTAVDYLAQSTGAYFPEDAVSVFQRGCINVLCQRGTPVIDGKVYVRVVENPLFADAMVGGLEAAEDGENTIQLVNAQWNGSADENGIAELRISDQQKAQQDHKVLWDQPDQKEKRVHRDQRVKKWKLGHKVLRVNPDQQVHKDRQDLLIPFRLPHQRLWEE